MRRIVFLFLIDVLITCAVAGIIYHTRGEEAALSAGLSIFIACSPLCWALANFFPLYLVKKKLAALGITVNNPAALKILSEVTVLGLPCNRILTCGEYFITDLAPDGIKQSALLAMAAAVERNSKNILGKVIFDAANRRNLKLQPSTDFEELSGRGAEARINGTLVRVGNPNWLLNQGVIISAILRTKTDQLLVKGKIVLLLSTGRIARGIIALRDELNADAKLFLDSLRQKKIESLLLTAQPKKFAGRIAKEFNLDHIRTNLTPEGKSREVQIFRAKGNHVAVIGSDFNDLPALANADVSFLLAGGNLNANEINNMKIDFELPTLDNFLVVREISFKVAEILKLNRRLALAAWIFSIPLVIIANFNPLAAVICLILFGAAILINSLRIK